MRIILNVFVDTEINGVKSKTPIMAMPVEFSLAEIQHLETSLNFCKNLNPSVPVPVKKEAHFKVCSVIGAMARWEREHG